MDRLSFLRKRGERPPGEQGRDASTHAGRWGRDPTSGKTLRRTRHDQRAVLVARQLQSRFRELQADQTLTEPLVERTCRVPQPGVQRAEVNVIVQIRNNARNQESVSSPECGLFDYALEEITKLKQQPGQNSLMTGSATLVQSVMEADLI